ncbi:MAG: cobalamin-binding protein [Candidatus Omnitrophota bacterium]|nr:cobalamin-binding protein [Candidatus Omnitrophota bacterium]
MRIVSLIPSSTEIVHALGCGDQLVGRSHECDFPAVVKSLPTCSEPKINIEGTSREIDDRVKETVSDSGSVYRIDAKALKALEPNVIITQDHCEVCAVSLKDVENAVCDWADDAKPEIVTLLPNNLEDVWSGIRRIAGALKVKDRGDDLINSYRERMQAISQKAKSIGGHPRVACLEWLDPLMAGGNWIPELLALLGAEDLFGRPGEHSPWMKWEELVGQDPDVIVVLPCGWGIEKSRLEMAAVTQKAEWKKLKAVRTGRVFLTDGNQYFNRPGPRLVESLEIFAEILYPEKFSFGHEGTGWQRF